VQITYFCSHCCRWGCDHVTPACPYGSHKSGFIPGSRYVFCGLCRIWGCDHVKAMIEMVYGVKQRKCEKQNKKHKTKQEMLPLAKKQSLKAKVLTAPLKDGPKEKAKQHWSKKFRNSGRNMTPTPEQKPIDSKSKAEREKLVNQKSDAIMTQLNGVKPSNMARIVSAVVEKLRTKLGIKMEHYYPWREELNNATKVALGVIKPEELLLPKVVDAKIEDISPADRYSL
jgi:hypothetical protein